MSALVLCQSGPGWKGSDAECKTFLKPPSFCRPARTQVQCQAGLKEIAQQAGKFVTAVGLTSLVAGVSVGLLAKLLITWSQEGHLSLQDVLLTSIFLCSLQTL